MLSQKIYKKETFGSERPLEYIVEWINNNPEKSRSLIRFLSRVNYKCKYLTYVSEFPLYDEILDLYQTNLLLRIKSSFKGKKYGKDLVTRLNNFAVTKIKKLRDV